MVCSPCQPYVRGEDPLTFLGVLGFFPLELQADGKAEKKTSGGCRDGKNIRQLKREKHKQCAKGH